MNTLQASWRIAKKDLKLAFRDRTGLALGFLLPAALVLVTGFIYKMVFGREDGANRVTLYATDLDQSDASKRFVTSLRESEMIELEPAEGKPAPTREELEKAVREGEAHHALIIESGFGEAIAEGKLPPLGMLRDPGRKLEDQMVSIALMQAVFSMGTSNLAPALTTRALQQAGLPSAWTDRIMKVSTGFSQSVSAMFVEAGLEDDAGKRDDRDEPAKRDASGSSGAKAAGPDMSKVFTDLVPIAKVDIQPPARPQKMTYMLAHSIAGMSCMMLMFGLVACGTMLLQERDQGTLRRLLLAPVSPGALLWGKVIYSMIMGALQLVAMFTVGGLLFQVNLVRHPLTLVVTCFALLFAITGFGTLVAGLSKTQKQAEGLSTLIILTMSALGGAWFPIDLFAVPTAFRVVSDCTLTHWAMHALKGMWYSDLSLANAGIQLDLAVLFGFGLVAMAIARLAFRRHLA